MDIAPIVSAFGKSVKAKLSSPVVDGQPEDQLRAPLETLISDIGALIGGEPLRPVLIGETQISELKTRPDYAVQKGQALIGHIEVKAPGKGANPRKFSEKHDKEQWAKLKNLPNLLYTDGQVFSL